MTTSHTRDMYSKKVYVYQVSRIELDMLSNTSNNINDP